MAYSATLKLAIGQVRAALESHIASAQAYSQNESAIAINAQEQQTISSRPVLVACSGGRDSMALAAVCHTVCGMLGTQCIVMIVDHQLQEESYHVAQRTAERLHTYGIEHVHISQVTVQETGEGIEAAARDARYEALTSYAKQVGACCIALAHTADDQAETIIMSLLKAQNVDALAGMPACTQRNGVTLVRPLLMLTREKTTQLCHDVGLSWWDDPTNGQNVPEDQALPENFPLRSRIRHDVMPLLRKFGGDDVSLRLSRNAQLSRQERQILDDLADQVLQRALMPVAQRNTPNETHAQSESNRGNSCEFGEEIIRLNTRVLSQEPRVIRLRALSHVLSANDIAHTARHVEAIDSLISNWHGQGTVHLPSGFSANRKKHVIRVCQDSVHANRRCTR